MLSRIFVCNNSQIPYERIGNESTIAMTMNHFQ
uniref:Uncharacterized protein n=1 Tax=Parascaris univalens TaxID=6257 RepID=A0A914ZN50_PARUN